MRVFIDTNILIDFVVNREGFSEDADKLFALGITGDIKLMTSALSYVTTMYIAQVCVSRCKRNSSGGVEFCRCIGLARQYGN